MALKERQSHSEREGGKWVAYQPEHPSDRAKLISPSRKDFMSGKFLFGKVTSERGTRKVVTLQVSAG